MKVDGESGMRRYRAGLMEQCVTEYIEERGVRVNRKPGFL